MTKQFMGTPNPEQCTTYGPRLWIKFSAGFLKGEEKDVYDRIVSLCLWSGCDKRLLGEEGDILSFEFLGVNERAWDDSATRVSRLNYSRALEVLKRFGYTEVPNTTEGHTNFFRGFKD